MELYKMLPYLVTIIVLVAVSMRKKRENEPPAALGLAYFREERSFQSSTVFAVELCYYALLAATGRAFMPPGGKKNVVSKFENSAQAERLYAGRACRAAERSPPNSVKVGKGSFTRLKTRSPRL